jgi:hypothetical protein
MQEELWQTLHTVFARPLSVMEYYLQFRDVYFL